MKTHCKTRTASSAETNNISPYIKTEITSILLFSGMGWRLK